MQNIIFFLRDERAATSIEYSVVACGIAVVIVTAVSCLSRDVKHSYVSILQAMY